MQLLKCFSTPVPGVGGSLVAVALALAGRSRSGSPATAGIPGPTQLAQLVNLHLALGGSFQAPTP